MYNWIDSLTIDISANGEGYFIYLDLVPYAGPYKRSQDARAQLTRLRKGYTPAARHPISE